MRVHLKLINGEQIDQSINEEVFVVGRSPKCDIVVSHEGMSRQHCQIELIDHEVYVTDLGSTNGVLIDGHKIEPHKKIRYATYLPLSFGAVQTMQIELEDPHSHGHSLQVRRDPPKKEMPKEVDQGTSLTKTKTINENARAAIQGQTGSQPRPAPAEKADKAKSIFVNLMALLILGGAVWWYMQKEETPEAAPEEDAPVTEPAPANDGRIQ